MKMTHQYQTEPGKNVVFEKETVVRSAGGKGGSPRISERNTEGFSDSYQSNGHHSSSYSDEPSLREYLKGFSKVAKKCMREYKEVSYDIFQSLFVLFMQHPAVGILFLVTGLFVLVPLGVYLGFAVVSFISIVVTALFIEGVLLGTGLVILFFVVPVAFITGLGVASFATATWLAVTAGYKFARRRYPGGESDAAKTQ